MACRVSCANCEAKLDYCNGILHGIYQLRILTNTNESKTPWPDARVVTGGRRYDHITPVLKELHWLPIKHRIDFKLATIVYKVKQTQDRTILSRRTSHRSQIKQKSTIEWLLPSGTAKNKNRTCNSCFFCCCAQHLELSTKYHKNSGLHQGIQIKTKNALL